MLAADYQHVPKTEVPCAGCGSNESHPACRGDRYGMGIRTVVCARCGLIFTSPRPSAEWFSDFYRNHYRQFYKKVSRPDEAWVKRPWIDVRHRRNVSFLAPHLPESGMALDAGCSEGTFLAFLQEQCPGWTVHGVETNAEFAEFARSYYGLQDITIAEIEDLVERSPEQFDFVAANHVLEHLLDPALFLATVRDLLKPGGLLFLDVPDAEGEKPGVWNLHIAHVYHFSTKTLGNLLRRHGFEIVTWKKGQETPHPWTLRVLARKGEAGVGSLPEGGDATGGRASHCTGLCRSLDGRRNGPKYARSTWPRLSRAGAAGARAAAGPPTLNCALGRRRIARLSLEAPRGQVAVRVFRSVPVRDVARPLPLLLAPAARRFR